MIRGGAVARRYARALFGLGQEAGDPATLLSELDSLTEVILGSDDLRRVLFAPIHPRRERRGVVRALANRLGVSAPVRAFAMILVDENRTPYLPQIADAMRELVDRAAGRVEADVVSARPLDDGEEQRVREALSARVGAQVTLKTAVDPALIGGVIARVGDLLLDGSVRAQLDSLRGSLRKGTA